MPKHMMPAMERGVKNKEAMVKQKEPQVMLAEKAVGMQNMKVKNIKHYGMMPNKA